MYSFEFLKHKFFSHVIVESKPRVFEQNESILKRLESKPIKFIQFFVWVYFPRARTSEAWIQNTCV